ncbi:MAG: GNAT family N-acetyltransferase [Micropruina sp.]|uniref:GNAT family N-acetyltransferase n=1 Tax=Micropruina sp. TaxID=2737536 RepID=UPI0039E5A1AB
MTDPIAIRPAAPDDLDAVLALEDAGFDQAARWSRDSWAAELAGADRCVLVAVDAEGSRRARPTDSRLLGVATVQLVAETADLHRVVVAPEQRGRGIGRALVEAGIAWAAQRQGRRMLLEVEHDNAPALALYRRLGFADLARRDDYYGTGRHALVLQRDLAGIADLAGTDDFAGTDGLAGADGLTRGTGHITEGELIG